MSLQAKYYDQKHRDIDFEEGDLVLLSTRNLEMKGVPEKLKKKFVGPFKIIQRIGQQAYKLLLPDTWKIHPVFHVSLLKKWNAISSQEEGPIEPEPNVEEPYYEIERILRWRKGKRGRKIIKEYLALWKGYPVTEASWVPQENFSHPEQLQHYLEEDRPVEEKV